jgi:hypothetical protein
MNGPRYSDVSLRELPPMYVVSYCAISVGGTQHRHLVPYYPVAAIAVGVPS